MYKPASTRIERRLDCPKTGRNADFRRAPRQEALNSVKRVLSKWRISASIVNSGARRGITFEQLFRELSGS